MTSTAKWIISAVVVPLLAAFGGSWVGTGTQLARLDERITAVKEAAAIGISDAKMMAQEAHKRIDVILAGGG